MNRPYFYEYAELIKPSWAPPSWVFSPVWTYSREVVYLNIPYLLWVLFATVLQFSITYLNR